MSEINTNEKLYTCKEFMLTETSITESHENFFIQEI